MTTEYWGNEPRITDILRRMVELARQVSRVRATGGEPKSPRSRKEVDRMAKIAMQMAISSLDRPASSNRESVLESMLFRRVAEEKQKRGAKDRGREVRERERQLEERLAQERRSVERRMLEEREKVLELQEVKYEALKKREEAERNAIEQRAADEIRKAKEEVIRLTEEAELARQAASRAQEEAEQAKREAEQAKEGAKRAKDTEGAQEEIKRVKEELERAKEEAERQRQRADRAIEEQKQQIAKDEAGRQSLQEQQEITAWIRYRNQWRLLKRVSAAVQSGEFLRFEDIPWPTVVPPTSPSMITDAEVAGFLCSGPPIREGETLKSRIKDTLSTWHPDKFSGRYVSSVLLQFRDLRS